jgi:peptide/nickel transport system substrate-binding protein
MRHFLGACVAALSLAVASTNVWAQSDDELRVAVANFGREVLDLGLTSTQDLQYTGHINDPLISGDDKGQLSSARGLVTSWSMSPDAKTFTAKLRDGVRWHDGKPFTADDVVFTLGERDIAPDAVCSYCGYLRRNIEKVEAPDATTVVVHLKESDLTFPSVLSSRDGDIRMLARHNYKKTANGYELDGSLIGTGPWKFVSFERGVSMQLAANQDYWDKSRVPQFKTMKLIPRAQPSTRLAMVRSGEVDMAIVDPRQAPDVKKAGLKLLLLDGSSIGVLALLGCWQQEMLCHDKPIREAIASAIDIQTIVKKYYPEGTGIPLANAFWSEASLGYDPALKPYAYNPQHARDLLKSIKYDGKKVRLWSVQTNSSPESPEIIQLIDGYLRAAGFQTEITPMEIGAFRPRYANNPQNFETSYAAHLYIDAPGARPMVLPNLTISFISKAAGGVIQGYADLPAIDATYKKLRAITDLKELDKALLETNRETYASYNLIPIAARATVAAAGPRVGSWSPGRYGFAWNLETVTRAK